MILSPQTLEKKESHRRARRSGGRKIFAFALLAGFLGGTGAVWAGPGGGADELVTVDGSHPLHPADNSTFTAGGNGSSGPGGTGTIDMASGGVMTLGNKVTAKIGGDGSAGFAGGNGEINLPSSASLTLGETSSLAVGGNGGASMAGAGGNGGNGSLTIGEGSTVTLENRLILGGGEAGAHPAINVHAVGALTLGGNAGVASRGIGIPSETGGENELVSYGNPTPDPNNFYGPYFDSQVQALYETVNNNSVSPNQEDLLSYGIDESLAHETTSTPVEVEYVSIWAQEAADTSTLIESTGGGNGTPGSGTLNLEGGVLQIGGINGISQGAGAAFFNFESGTIQVIGSDLTTFVPMSLGAEANIDTNGFNALFFGALSGNGSLNKVGLGIAALFAANTYSGGTTLTAGTLQADNDAALGTGPIVFAGGTLRYGYGVTHDFSNQFSTTAGQLYSIDPDGNDITFASNLTSSGGSLTLNGSGQLILSGTNTYNGGTTINGGTLAIANPQALGDGGVSIVGGTLTTAGSNHLITAQGNYNQGSGGTLLLNVLSGSVYDTLNVHGTVALGGTLELNFANGFIPEKGATFEIISTPDSITGTFTSIVSNLLALRVTATDPDSVEVLQISQAPFASLPGIGYTPNQRSVAAYIDRQDQTSTNAGFNHLVAALDDISSSGPALGNAFDQLNPIKFQSFATSTAFNNTSFTLQQFDNYLANHRGADGAFVGSEGGLDYSGLTINDPQIDTGLQSVHSRLLAWNPAPNRGLISDVDDSVLGGTGMVPSAPADLWNVFVTGSVVLSQTFSDASAGIPGSNSTTGGVQMGVDYRITPHWLAGVTFGYGHTDATLDNLGSDATVNTYSPGLYASYSDHGWFANALGSYGFSGYSQTRNVSIGTFSGAAHGSPGGGQIVGDVDGGYEFHKGPWTFGPTLGLQYVHLNVDGYTETGLPGANLTIGRNGSDSLRSRLGGQISYTLKTSSLLFTPHLSASWQHEFMDQSRGITSQFSELGAGSFTVNTPAPSRESALADLGLDVQINNALTAFLDYSVQAGQSNYFGQSVQAGVKIGF